MTTYPFTLKGLTGDERRTNGWGEALSCALCWVATTGRDVDRVKGTDIVIPVKL